MDRLERAEAWCYQHRKSWEGTVDCTEKFMSAFAASEVRAERARIASELRGLGTWHDLEGFIAELEEQDA